MARASSLLAFAMLTTFGCAASAEDFYRGKTITIVTSTGAGGAFDLMARVISRHMPRHLPGGPTIVVRNMPGGGHTLATNYMFSTAPRDGTYLATVNNSIPLHQALDGRGVRFDARKFGWIGSTGISNLLNTVWHTSGVTSMSQAYTRQIVTGATGTGSGTYIYPNAMNQLLGTKFKIVTGYATSPQIDLAMERGEVEARSGASLAGYLSERPDWIKERKIIVISQIGASREKTLPDVPLIHELARNEEQARVLRLISSPVLVGRPFFAPPEVPADRLARLRSAFSATMADPAFLAEAGSLSLDLNPMGWEQLTRLVEETIATPPEMLTRAKSMIEPAATDGAAKSGTSKAGE